ncbi:MAG: hypothetical protein E4H13_02525 [Calditrichales bacterium]|nr:MAG: hypothetical protein E4H13_02525 [Calditrichales bacterium]
MKTGTFYAEVDREGNLSIPREIRDRLNLAPGDKIEIMLKKIQSKRFGINIQKNPLFKMLELSEMRD